MADVELKDELKQNNIEANKLMKIIHRMKPLKVVRKKDPYGDDNCPAGAGIRNNQPTTIRL